MTALFRGPLPAGLLVTLSACVGTYLAYPAGENPSDRLPVRWSAAVVAKDRSFDVAVTAAIEPGWHVYGLRETALGPSPTRIGLAPDQPFTVVGKVTSTPPLVAFDSNFNSNLAIHRGTAAFRIRVKPTAQPLARSVTVRVRYQACSGETCLPPRTVDIEAGVPADAR